MGYSTDFFGGIKISPPLNEKEISFLEKFSGARRVVRNVDSDGRYYITNGQDNWGQTGSNILKHNDSPTGQPGLWCGFHASEDGKFLVWNEGEKTYDGAAWVNYLIVHFLGNNPLMEKINPELYAEHGFTPHLLNGVLYAKGEEMLDAWMLKVVDNQVFVQMMDENELPEELEKKEEDPDSDEDDEEENGNQYNYWYSLGEEDLRKLKYLPEAMVEYETEDVYEQEYHDVQKSLRPQFVKDYKDAMAKVTSIVTGKKSNK